MGARFWQLTTFLATATAGYLALAAPLRGPAPAPKKVASGTAAATPTPNSNPLEQLDKARTPTAVCRALAQLPAETASRDAARERLRDSQLTVRRCAALALIRMGASGGASALDVAELKDRAQDADATVRQAALDQLARSDLPGARPYVIDLASGDAPARRRHEAMQALAGAGRPEVVPMLTAEIDRSSGQLRRRLIGTLGQVHRPEAAVALAAMVARTSGSTRRDIYHALAQVGGEVAVAVLKKGLLEGVRDEVQTCAQGLAQLDDAEARETLLAAALRPERPVARAAMNALANLDGSDIRDLMLEQLRASDDEMVSAACRYFGAHPDEAVTSQLAQVAGRESRQASNQAVHALGRMGGDLARKTLLELASRPGLAQYSALQQLQQWPEAAADVRKILVKVSSEGGYAAQRVLWHLEEDGSDEARTALIQAFKTGGSQGGSAAHYLARSGHPDAVRALGEAALGSEHHLNQRLGALSALGQSGDRKAVDTLGEALKDSNPQVQHSALNALAQIGGPEAERLVREASTDGNATVRAASVHALGQLGTAEAKEQLQQLVKDEDSNVARNALNALASHDPAAARGLITELMQTNDVERRQTAVQTATYLEGEAGRNVLVQAVKDTDPGVAATAARGLGRLGGSDARSTLETLFLDSRADRVVRLAAADGLEQLGGDGTRRLKDQIARLRQPPPPAQPELE